MVVPYRDRLSDRDGFELADFLLFTRGEQKRKSDEEEADDCSVFHNVTKNEWLENTQRSRNKTTEYFLTSRILF